MDWNQLIHTVQSLLMAAQNLDNDRIQSLLKLILPTYSPRNFDNLIKNKSIGYSIKGEA